MRWFVSIWSVKRPAIARRSASRLPTVMGLTQPSLYAARHRAHIDSASSAGVPSQSPETRRIAPFLGLFLAGTEQPVHTWRN